MWTWIIARVTGFSPMVWVVLACFTAAGGALGTAYFMGKTAARNEAKIAELQAKIAGMERDIMVAGVADLVTEAEMSKLEEENVAAEKRIADYELELRSRPNDACLLLPDDIDRMQHGGQR